MQRTILPRLVRRKLVAALESRAANVRPAQRRWLTRAPKPGDGPMLARRADRELPDVDDVRFQWRRTLPIFLVIVTTCSVAIFNYQKMSSPIISSTLYALRTSPEARELLGDEIYFKHQIPWIHGEMNQLHGRIDIWFSVRGSKGSGSMHFASNRPGPKAFFQTTDWSLTMEDGTRLDLLDLGDPFRGLLGGADEDDVAPPMTQMEQDAITRGFRKQVEYK
ncbi:cytochrome oxidase complex assembly protein 1-domain-containing protein [Dactylonectria macrodidyma]|uniref:Cytochrome oxidase complex assembly protein 1-domain-containing protein n=1 Tax=Dactylonectria macrodidyma TaxID=307937 RepID=A0A9P9F3S7_9HYPO|nr:cytochrome oxidase complex assembly protein 1-domain-containing protein [Dactylonectria macrodidyma]